MECPQHFVPAVIAKIGGMRPSFRIPKGDSSVEDTPLVECPQHFVSTVFAKIDGMRPSFRIPKGDSSVEDTPLVHRSIQSVQL